MIDALPLLLGDDGYQISRSVRLRSSASAWFNRTPSSAGNRKTWTWSAWIKRGALGSVQLFWHSETGSTNQMYFAFGATTANSFRWLQYNAGSVTARRDTAMEFRDPSAWYHLCCVWDTTNATAANRMLVYVNGVQVTAFSTSVDPSLNLDSFINNNTAHNLGRGAESSTIYYLDGYLTEVNFIDGQALTPAAFGETDAITGVWKPRRYTGTYGTNGFFLNFSDPSAATAAAIGKDYSGNGNNWTPNNISVTAGVTYDSMLDVPTPWADGGNGRGNYCTLNPLDQGSGTNQFIKEGNLLLETGSTGYSGTRCTMATPTSGKWYWEVTQSVISGGMSIGIASASADRPQVTGESATSYGYQNDGNKRNNLAATSYGATYTTNDVIGVALDLDAGTLVFYKNNTSQGTAFSGLSGSFMPMLSDLSNSLSSSAYVNFGQRPFAYTPPTGFRALNTQNLPEPTIVRGNRFMDATLYTGTGATRSVTNTGGFQPDLVWIKSRAAARSNILFDAVRGIAASSLYSNATNAEDTAFTDGLTAYNASGFSLGADSLSRGTNVNTDSYVAWQWREGATQGFDIVTYTGTGANRTVAHNLGVAPKMMIVKNRGIADSWRVWHSDIGGANRHLVLNATSATSTAANFFTAVPTSTEFTVGSDDSVNKVSTNLVAYLFSEVAGFSRFGSYTGNGSADGPFVFCGFRPRWVMVKRTDTTANWGIADTARSPINAGDQWLFANLSDAEYAGTLGANIDVLSNGFKLRIAGGAGFNTNGGTYIFAAFAETAFRYALAR